MTLNIGSALETAVERTTSRAGLSFVAALVVLQALNLLFVTNYTAVAVGSLPNAPSSPGQLTPVSLGLGTGALAVLVLLTYLVLLVVSVALIRSMVSDVDDRIPSEFFTRRIVTAAVWWLVATVVLSVLIMLGTFLVVVPGLFLAVSLLFTVVYVAVEDENAFAAMRSSWRLASGNRWRLFGAALAAFVPYMVVYFAVTAALPLSTVAGWVVGSVLSGAWVVFLQALVAACYRQLRDEGDGDTDGDGPADGDDPAPHATVADA